MGSSEKPEEAMSAAPVKSASVQELLAGVRRAFGALVPIAESLGVRWREPDNYVDWDAIARGVFEGLALAAIRSSVGWEGSFVLAEYDKRVADYADLSYVAVELRGGHLPLVCLATTTHPFDTCLVAELDSDLKVHGLVRVLFDECKFVVVRRSASGQTCSYEILTW